MPDAERLKLGVSACLLGQAVRHDGGHKRDDLVAGLLAKHFEMIPLCPEVAIGLGVPRPPIRLVQTAAGIRARGVQDATLDVTDALNLEAQRVARQMPDLSGYILKSKSPSCGMARVKLHTPTRREVRIGVGAYTAGLLACSPLWPMEEETGLQDPSRREHFIERVFAYARWQVLVRGRVSGAALMEFHSRHKYQLLAHNQAAYRRIGRLVAGAGSSPPAGLLAQYASELMTALSRPASTGNHVNVLQHFHGYLKDVLGPSDKAGLIAAIDAYERQDTPLRRPLTLLRQHFRCHPQLWAAQQTYLIADLREQQLRELPTQQ
ncbi:MAG: YbgA family protein [Immundisolibacter sp.]|uniref:YbgA family protein n=1 Tax=Immundisolibacter sp. TaxID=1934948 RepID=UPI003EE00FDA